MLRAQAVFLDNTNGQHFEHRILSKQQVPLCRKQTCASRLSSCSKAIQIKVNVLPFFGAVPPTVELHNKMAGERVASEILRNNRRRV